MYRWELIKMYDTEEEACEACMEHWIEEESYANWEVYASYLSAGKWSLFHRIWVP